MAHDCQVNGYAIKMRASVSIKVAKLCPLATAWSTFITEEDAQTLHMRLGGYKWLTTTACFIGFSVLHIHVSNHSWPKIEFCTHIPH